MAPKKQAKRNPVKQAPKEKKSEADRLRQQSSEDAIKKMLNQGRRV